MNRDQPGQKGDDRDVEFSCDDTHSIDVSEADTTPAPMEESYRQYLEKKYGRPKNPPEAPPAAGSPRDRRTPGGDSEDAGGRAMSSDQHDRAHGNDDVEFSCEGAEFIDLREEDTVPAPPDEKFRQYLEKKYGRPRNPPDAPPDTARPPR